MKRNLSFLLCMLCLFFGQLSIGKSYTQELSKNEQEVQLQKFDRIKSELLKWMKSDGPDGVKNEGRISLREYKDKMLDILESGKVIVQFVEKDNSADDELKVSVDGIPKTCRGFISDSLSKKLVVE